MLGQGAKVSRGRPALQLLDDAVGESVRECGRIGIETPLTGRANTTGISTSGPTDPHTGMNSRASFLSHRFGLPRFSRRAILLLCVGSLPWMGPSVTAQPALAPVTWHLTARIVAVGMPGVAGVRQIGRFHNGGPFPSNPEFLLQTGRGRVLDPQRLMVAVASNFGAPTVASGGVAGTVLSIDPGLARPLVVDAKFARAGGQAQSAGGAIQVYSAQSSAFLNARHNASALTAASTSVAGTSIRVHQQCLRTTLDRQRPRWHRGRRQPERRRP